MRQKQIQRTTYLNQGSQKLRDNAQRRHRYNHNTLPSHILTTASVWHWRRSGRSLAACAPAARRSLTRRVPKTSPHPRRHCLLDDAITRLRLHQYGDSEISDETQSYVMYIVVAAGTMAMSRNTFWSWRRQLLNLLKTIGHIVETYVPQSWAIIALCVPNNSKFPRQHTSQTNFPIDGSKINVYLSENLFRCTQLLLLPWPKNTSSPLAGLSGRRVWWLLQTFLSKDHIAQSFHELMSWTGNNTSK